MATNLHTDKSEEVKTMLWLAKPIAMHIYHRMSASNYRFTAAQVSKNNVLDL
jgi:hypothetical protein